MEYCGAKLSLQNDCSANYESVGMCLLRLYARASTASRRGTKEAAQSPCPCPISTRILIYRRRQFLRTVGRASPRHPQIAAETCRMWPRRITPTMRPPPTRLRRPSERRSFLGKDVGQLRQSRCVHAGLVVQEFGYSAVVGLGAIAAIRLALWLMAPPTVGPTNGIRDRLQIMHSGPSRKLDGAARPPDAAGACI
jgi:hypothetical protein